MRRRHPSDQQEFWQQYRRPADSTPAVRIGPRAGVVVIRLAEDVVSRTEFRLHARTQFLHHAGNIITEHHWEAILNVETPVADTMVVRI